MFVLSFVLGYKGFGGCLVVGWWPLFVAMVVGS